jgi:hypothetical protein
VNAEGEHIPLLEKEGWPRNQENGSVPKQRGRGGQFGETFRPEDFRRTDHPVCGASVASQSFLMPRPPLLFKESFA